jgi:TRAP-type C4-dicarboxylate transport system substrate-binding protein
MKLRRAFFAGLSAALLAAGPARAEKYQLSGWAPPSHVMTRETHIAWADAVRKASNGKIDFQVFSSGALLPPLSTAQGIRDGVAQAGHVSPAYHPSEYPLANLVGDLGHGLGDPLVLASAFLDYIVNDPAGNKEWISNGSVPIVGVSTPANRYICRVVVRTLDDLKGKRVRTPGGGWARVTEALGAVPVNIPFTEIYTSLERGAVDCVVTDANNLTGGITIVDLTKSVVMLPIQPGYNTSQLAMNLPFWRGLTSAERRMLLNEAAAAMARSHIVFDREEAAALQAAKAKGVQIIEPDPTLKAAYGKWVAGGFGGVVGYARERLKITEPEKVMTTFQGSYMDKWSKLFNGVDRTNQAAVVGVLKTNLFDKINVDTYGMK